jgi:hypothetical protein
MYNVGLRICSFHIKPHGSQDHKRIPLNNEIKYELNKGFPLVVKDFFVILSDFVKRYSSYDDDEKQMRMFAIVKEDTKPFDTDRFRALYITIKSGAYGYESELTDKDSGKVNYVRTTNDADIKQFSCLFFIPRDSDQDTIKKGIIVFQEIGAYGVKTVTLGRLAKYLASRYALSFETRSVSPSTFVKEVLKNGEVQKITFVKNTISRDEADNLLVKAGREEVSFFSPIFRQSAIDNLFRPRITNDTGIIEIDDEVFNDEMLGDNRDIKFSVKYGNRHNTISMMDYSQFSKVEDVPEELLLPSGQPDRGLLSNYMIQIAHNYRENMILV